MAVSTPWGMADTVKELAPGIVAYTTASHGGIRLSAERQADMPPLLAIEGGWYEEDCAYAHVICAFPEEFAAIEIALAVDSLRRWHHDKKAVESYLFFDPRGQVCKRYHRDWYRNNEGKWLNAGGCTSGNGWINFARKIAIDDSSARARFVLPDNVRLQEPFTRQEAEAAGATLWEEVD